MIKKELMAILNLNEDGVVSKELIENRPLASLPIAGRYRLIDFMLSNISNSGVRNVGIFTQRKTRSLYDHLGDGSPWDLDVLRDGLFIFSQQYEVYEKLSKGDIYTVYQNIDYLENSSQKYVFIAPSNFIYSIDLQEVYDFHINSEKDITLLYKKVENADKDFYNCTTLNISGGKAVSIGRNVGLSKNQNIALDAVIMKKNDFIELIYHNMETGENAYIIEAIEKKILDGGVNLFEFKGYVKVIRDVKSYVEFAKDTLNANISKELFKNPKNLIYTKIKDEAPTYFSDDSSVTGSVIASGCIIEGTVKNSIIFRKVKIEKGTIIENSIIMQNTTIEKNAYLQHVICDKNSVVSHGKKLIGDNNMPIIIKKGETV